MAVHKVVGIETEFGILHRCDGESNPVAASSMLINAYVNGSLEQGTGWDFENEHPGSDARGFGEFDALAPEVETHLVNAVLSNGARYYVDHAHPEMSTPECSDARQCTVYDRAAEETLIASMKAANALLPDGEELVVHKNNSDGKGNSYGCHENYLVDRDVPFGRVVAAVTPFFVTRPVFCGAGKLGREVPFDDPDAQAHARAADDDVLAGAYQISQRADFFEEEVGLETTLKRPVVNTRDEPHADSRKYRRLHVIVGDANMSETQTYLKLGTTSFVLSMVDDGFLRDLPRLADPVTALRQVSCDTSLRRPLALADGRRATALELQWYFLGAAREYAARHGCDAVGGEEIGHDVLDRWEAVLSGLETGPERLSGVLDWVAKLRLLRGFAERHGLGPDEPRLVALDLQYHDLRPAKCLARRVGLARITDDAEATAAMSEPPTTTRAYFRGRCVERFGSQVVSANWDSIVFDVGAEPLRRVPMSEPLRGTRDHVGSLLSDCDDAAELLRRLGE